MCWWAENAEAHNRILEALKDKRKAKILNLDYSKLPQPPCYEGLEPYIDAYTSLKTCANMSGVIPWDKALMYQQHTGLYLCTDIILAVDAKVKAANDRDKG